MWVCISNLHGLRTIPENSLGTVETGRDPGKAKKPERIPANLGWWATVQKGCGADPAEFEGEFPFSTRPRGWAGRVSYYPPFTLKTTCKLTENQRTGDASQHWTASYRIAGIFRGVYISRISRKGPSLLTLKPRNLITESGSMRLMPLL